MVYHKLHYNIRGQLCDVRASNVDDEWGGELGALVNYYSTPWTHCGSGADNNGNVLGSQTIINSYYMEDRYSYDALNRLTAVNEWQNGATHTGSQQYDYDRWGNRRINPATWGTGINNKQFNVDANNNRLTVPAGQTGVMSYDPSGNLTNDTYTGAGDRTYDAENKITSAWGGNNQAQLYAYDANGQRIKRTVDGVETWQVYGFGGELIAEYPANGAAAAPQKEYGYRNGQLLITAEASTNVASAANGATVSASSTLSNPPFTYPVGAVNNGDRKGVNAGFGGNWHSSSTALPQWVQVDFSGSKTISEVNVFSLQDNYSSPSEPSEAMTFNLYGLTGFEVQYWNGSAWTTVPGGTVTGNNKVWKKLSFTPLTTSKIRVLINATSDGWSRMVEVEAWTTGSSNVKWLVPDHLGTPRMIIDQTGTLANIKRHDYLPFGEELFAPAGGRSTALGYSGGDAVRQQFTLKERDVETGLDYFLARYYSSTQGRFTSPDEFTGGPRELFFFADSASANPTFYSDLTNPQSLNKYQYAYNNPLR
ncbi:MAG TPA: RHS repeat-associated core domain-containing protein, partial [Pyrinomonadaceae bacterium]|nr:RHS repeat-associated core domain-containing protein [Pyrinomonadaceae bacterium]